MARLVGSFFGLSLLVVSVVAGVAYTDARASLEESVLARLSAVAGDREYEVNRWIAEQRDRLEFAATLVELKEELSFPEAGYLDAFLRRIAESGADYAELFVLSAARGRVIASTDPRRVGDDRDADPFFVQGREATYTQTVYPSPHDGRPTLTIATPVRNVSGRTLAVVAAHLDLTHLDRVVEERSGLGETGEAYLVSRFNDFVSSERFGRERHSRGVHTPGVEEALAGNEGVGLYENYAGVPVIGAHRWLGDQELALLVEMEQSEAYAPARRLLVEMLLIGLASALILAAGIYLLARRIASPILSVASAASRVAAGDFDVTAPVLTNDEVGLLARSFNEMTARLRELYTDLHGQIEVSEATLTRLEESEDLLQSIIDSSNTLVFVTDGDHRFVLVNHTFEEVFRVDRLAVVGRLVTDVIPGEVESVHAALEEAASGEGPVQRVVEIGPGEAPRTYLAAAFQLGGRHASRGRLALVATDLTERKRAEEERRLLEAQMQHAQKLESLGVLAGGIAHDFNNLLAAILGHADLARLRAEGDTELREHLDQVVRASTRAADLTRQMLAYAGRSTFDTRLVDLNTTIREMGSLLEISLPKKVEFRYQLDDRPALIRGDPAQIGQIAMNLVTNAAEAIGEDTGVVTLSTRRARVRGRLTSFAIPPDPGQHYVVLRVTDTGAGMDDATMARIFDPFFTTKDTGRGLGLAAVLGIVKGSGGTLRVKSAAGVGTTFEVYLPAESGSVEGAAPRDEPGPVRRGTTVLLVDDEEAVRTLVRRLLERDGHRVIEAGDGREGVTLFRARSPEIDIVVLDLTMPELSGLEVFEAIRGVAPRIPVVFSSGYDGKDTLARVADAPLVEFLQKPFRPDALRATIRQVLAASGSSGAGRAAGS